MTTYAVLIAALCLGQSNAEDEVFREGEIVVYRDNLFDEATRERRPVHRLMVAGVYFGREHRVDNGPLRRKATTYYHAKGPVGSLMSELRPTDTRLPASLIASSASPFSGLVDIWSERPIGVVGLHSGTMATYATPFQSFFFFECNPTIVKLVAPEKGEAIFYAVEDAKKRGAAISIVPGDARNSLAKGPQRYFKFLFIEMCQRIHLEDAEVELFTKEGVKACVDTLAPDGVVCFHTSNRYLDMARVLDASAKANGYFGYVIRDSGVDRVGGRNPNRDDDHFSSEWVVIGRDKKALEAIKANRTNPQLEWQALDGREAVLWTDAGPNKLGSLLRSDPQVSRLFDAINRFWMKVSVRLSPQTQRQIDDHIRTLGYRLSEASARRLESRGVTADWLRKTK